MLGSPSPSSIPKHYTTWGLRKGRRKYDMRLVKNSGSSKTVIVALNLLQMSQFFTEKQRGCFHLPRSKPPRNIGPQAVQGPGNYFFAMLTIFQRRQNIPGDRQGFPYQPVSDFSQSCLSRSRGLKR
jgi:hypothetical protein